MRRKKLFTAILVFAMVITCGLLGCSKEKGEQSSDREFANMGDVSADAFYVLLIGNDTRIGTVDIDQPNYADGNARSDVTMLARIDKQNYQVTLITVPRDTETDYEGTPGKLNHAYRLGGPEAAVDAVEDLTGVAVKYYLDVDFVQFENIINALGGIAVSVPNDMSMKDIVGGEKISLTAGTQELDGAEALVLSRMRKIYATDQDAIRQMTNRNIVEAGILQVAANPATARAAADALVANCDTNWPADELADLVVDFANHADEIVIYKATGPYEGDINPKTEEWLTERDEATWARIISTANEGKNPSGICPNPDIIVLEEYR